ncbi:GntR family transcriptional regulator [Sphingorhabdus sp. M41]|uniref:GntR family transcriptional regulator n=1 Tax=Sphingorhabdus sp. M41 TaxID=1806885 RepID=UPI00078CDC26|nr:GntR family transcriptional regulator [Sphingorhabdus sp. M41]AMO72566.1 hypothetical protein AZE99_12535 [Sphingorhabdus sp. M41]
MEYAKVGQRAAALPLYYQIYSSLRDRIKSGELSYGASLPTEHELSEQFGVSRITARRAMKELSENGLVERRRRTGTKVIYRSPLPTDSDGRTTIDSLIAFGRETLVKIISYEVSEATLEESAALEIECQQRILRVERLRLVKNLPLGIIESILPLEATQWVSEEKLANNPLLELLSHSGREIRAGQQVISAVAAGPEIALRLELEPRAPLLRIERLLRSEDGKPMARTIAQYRGDRYQLALDLDAVPHPMLRTE